jgi:hypothetical protein
MPLKVTKMLFILIITTNHFYVLLYTFTIKENNIELDIALGDRLCGLVVRVLGYRSGGPGSIPGTTRKKN